MRAALGLAGGIAVALALHGPSTASPGNGAKPHVVRVEHRDPTTAPTRGHPHALVTVEYFFAPNVPAGSRMKEYRMLEELYQKHPGRVRIVYRVIKSSAGVQLPTAALEAHAQGKFFELMDALHEPRPNAALTKEQVLELAREIGMDASRLAAAISDGRYADTFAANEQRMHRLRGGERSVAFNSRLVRVNTDADLEREYASAYGRALELIDQGYEPRDLPKILDQQMRRAEQPFVISTGPIDDDLEGDPTEHPLAQPPIDVAGLPSFGRPDASAPLPILVLCRPNDVTCGALLRIVRKQVQDVYPDEVRAFWGPWFDVTHEQAADLTMLGDAALCAEQVGSSPDELSASPGWRWITKQLDHASRTHGRRQKAHAIIGTIATELDVDAQRLSACRARNASATLAFIEKARKSGVTRSPAIVIGGRIYEGLGDEPTIHKLIEAELAPGVLGETAESHFERLLFFLSSPKRR